MGAVGALSEAGAALAQLTEKTTRSLTACSKEASDAGKRFEAIMQAVRISAAKALRACEEEVKVDRIREL